MARTKRNFRPPVWGTLCLILAGSICVGAGIWQLDRAEQKRRIFAAFEDADDQEIRNEPVNDQVVVEFRYQRFSVRGRYDGEHQILLDNMIANGRAGYHVLTPLKNGGKAILINRGWIPANPDRSLLPAVPVDGNPRQVTGRLNLLPRPGVQLETLTPARDAAWPRRLLFPTVTELVEQLGYGIYDYQLLLNPDDPDGYVRDWKPALMGPERHLAYAIQWFSLAVTLLIIYLVVNWRVIGKTA